jgi:hypothetical protein
MTTTMAPIMSYPKRRSSICRENGKKRSTRAEDGRKVLEAADKELKQLSRLSLSFYHVTVLKHIRDKLAVYRFKADMAAFLELDMLTTAFVATYVRLHTGGSGSGFARDALPEALRSAHDEIIDMRNKRYAHVAEHDSVNDEMEIQEDEGRFIVNLGFRFGFYIGGSNDWTKLVDALDEIFAERGQKIVERLQARTGREWSIAQGPLPTRRRPDWRGAAGTGSKDRSLACHSAPSRNRLRCIDCVTG